MKVERRYRNGMAKSKTKRGNKEYDLVDRLKHENEKLKKQVASLRKIVSRVDLNRYEHLKELVEHQRQEQKKEEKQEGKKQQDRTCYHCGEGRMDMYIFNRRDGVHYYRACTNNCGNRTRMKKYSSDVKP